MKWKRRRTDSKDEQKGANFRDCNITELRTVQPLQNLKIECKKYI